MAGATDTHLYRTAADFHDAFPRRLQAAGPRVLKQNRGNAGQGVWKVELVSPPADEANPVRVLHARRGSLPEEMALGDFMTRCEAYFTSDGCIVDQPFQPRLPDGMIRCYMGADKVVGFGHQFIKALIPPPPEGPDSPAAQPGPRIMHGADAEPFQALRTKMETEWIAADDGGPRSSRRRTCRSSGTQIFSMGRAPRVGEDTYVLCEINVSSVFAIPDQAPAAIARLALERLRTADTRSRAIVLADTI